MTETATPEAESTEPRKRQWVSDGFAKRLTGLTIAMGFVALVSTFMPLLGDLWWRSDLFAHFRFQYALGLGLACIAARLARSWKWLAVLGIALVFNLVSLAPFWWPAAQPDGAGPTVRVLQLNVWNDNENKAAATQWVASQSADLVVLQEIDFEWLKAATNALPGYHLVQASPRSDSFGLAVYGSSRVTVIEAHTDESTGQVPSVVATLEVEGKRFEFLAVHTLPPFNEEQAYIRDLQLDAVIEMANTWKNDGILIGDLNATPWSMPMKRLAKETSLRDSTSGQGYQGSWPDDLWFTGMIPIDHVWVTPGVRVEDRWVGPGVGSDHRGLVADLVLVGE